VVRVAVISSQLSRRGGVQRYLVGSTVVDVQQVALRASPLTTI
jgi:hypothetical protein